MASSDLEEFQKETQKLETINDWYQYLDEPFILEDALELFEHLKHTIPKDKLEAVISRFDDSKKVALRQHTETYNELIVGKDLHGFANKHGYQVLYEVKYSHSNARPDWTVIDKEERFALELVTKHKSEHSLIIDAIVARLHQHFGEVEITSTQFPESHNEVAWKFSKVCPGCKILNLYCDNLIERIEHAHGVLQDSEKDICIDGLRIVFNGKGGNNRFRGSVSHRYMLSIVEKASKMDSIAEKYPLIIGVMGSNHLRTSTTDFKNITDWLFGNLCTYPPEQLNLSKNDYDEISRAIPSLKKLAGIMFYDLKYKPKRDDATTHAKVRLRSCKYFRNPHYNMKYPRLLEYYLLSNNHS